jgi:hypothetical protein
VDIKDLTQEQKSEINALRQRAINYARGLATSFNIVHSKLVLSFEIEVKLEAKADKAATLVEMPNIWATTGPTKETFELDKPGGKEA